MCNRIPKFVSGVLDLLRRQNKAVISPMSGAKKRAAIDGRRVPVLVKLDWGDLFLLPAEFRESGYLNARAS